MRVLKVCWQGVRWVLGCSEGMRCSEGVRCSGVVGY